MPVDVALASCHVLPEPDVDLEPLLDALRRDGMSAEVLAWDGPGSGALDARVTVLRSTWNYPERPADFLAWIDRTAARSALWNPPATVRWSAHKRYLLDLEARGVPVVPTHLARRGERAHLAEVLQARGWGEVVVKPAVSCGSRKTVRVRPADLALGEAHFRGLVAHEDVLVQPFVRAVEGSGERAIVVIDGEPTHAVRKTPRFLGDAEQVSEAVPIAPDEAALATRALAMAPTPLLYGRVDMARDDDGAPRIMELELLEPSLFLTKSDRALERLVRGIRARLQARAALPPNAPTR